MQVKNKKKKQEYYCGSCGYIAFQWLGKCPDCGEWNSFQERISKSSSQATSDSIPLSQEELKKIKHLSEIEELDASRVTSGSSEFDRVLGGGLLLGASVLLAGEPGIGKSTLLLKSAVRMGEALSKADMSSEDASKSVFYISAEESQNHIKQRANRLGLNSENFFVVAETDVNIILNYLAELKPAIVIVDSIQAIYNPELGVPPGSLTQVRESAVRLCQFSRDFGSSVILIGHVTKDGALAGPKSLEHLVDTVIYFEGDRYDDVRLLRAIKNRHGATGEVGLFEMRENGLIAVENPSEFFIAKDVENLPGRATVSLMEGRRPFLVEVQALVNQTFFNNPLRRAVGVELNKVTLLIAVMEKSLNLNFSKFDLFVKSAGGIFVNDPGADLPIAVSLISSLKQKQIPNDFVFIGEIGLGGEIRKVKWIQARLKEADRLGFRKAYVPKGNLKGVGKLKMSLVEVNNLAELYSDLFAKTS